MEGEAQELIGIGALMLLVLFFLFAVVIPALWTGAYQDGREDQEEADNGPDDDDDEPDTLEVDPWRS